MSSVPVPVRPYLDAIAGGYHRDPFSVLGLHEEKRRVGGARVSASGRVGGTAAQRPDRRDGEAPPTGVWLASFDERPPRYQFRPRIGGVNSTSSTIPIASRPPHSISICTCTARARITRATTPRRAHRRMRRRRGRAFRRVGAERAVVSVVGEFNDWDTRRHPMRLREAASGSCSCPAWARAPSYKYYVRSRFAGYAETEGRPIRLRAAKCRRKSASVVLGLDSYEWRDDEWMAARAATDWLQAADVDLRSAPRIVAARADGDRSLSYRELADKLVPVREADGLHPHRTAAHHGASVLAARGATR